MSEILARIRVRETHGIRRFLYPLTAYVNLPLDTDLQNLTLSSEDKSVPIQAAHTHSFRLDFPVFLDPYAERELILTVGKSEATLDDPLILEKNKDEAVLHNKQTKFSLDIKFTGGVEQVVYDGVTQFRQPLRITYNGLLPVEDGTYYYNMAPEFSLITAWAGASSGYSDGTPYSTATELTACKSWATVTHTLKQPKPNDEVVFTLPLAITSPTLTCDFGVGGYVFGKLDSNAPEIVWRTEFGDAPYAKWTVATAGRVDYMGEVEAAEAFVSQRWFHLIDSDKALAVAITQLPEGCQSMTVRMTHEGDVSITFKLGDTVTDPAEFGVCYHFLNDVPAIAAATNPQSILLPPVVEVLPSDLAGWRE